MLSIAALRKRAGESEYLEGERLYTKRAFHQARASRGMLAYVFPSDSEATVTLSAQSGAQCTCGKPYCRHGIAAVLAAASDGQLQEMLKRHAIAAAPALLAAAEGMLPQDGTVTLEPLLAVTPDGLRVGLRVGEERLYVVRHIPQFLQCVKGQTPVPFGKGFVFQPSWMRFSADASGILDMLEEYCEVITRFGTPPTGADARLLPLTEHAALRLLRLLADRPFRLMTGGQTLRCAGIRACELPLSFDVSGSPRALMLSADMPALTPLVPSCEFVLMNEQVVRVQKEQVAIVQTLLQYSSQERAQFAFTQADIPRVMSELLPSLMRAGPVTYASALEKQLVRLPLKAKVYLDKEGADITARTEFCYGEMTVDPFCREDSTGAVLLMRDTAGERAVLDLLAGAGFHVRRGQVYLCGQDAVYEFVTRGVSALSQCCEVFCSNAFKRLTPKKANLTGTLRAQNGRLTLELFDDGTPIDELLPLMEALRARRAYFRYKDGAYLSLEDTQQYRELAQAVLEAAQSTRSAQDLGLFRAAYIKALLGKSDLPVQVDDEAARLSRMDAGDAPQSPVVGLRPYQERGFAWLHALHALNMGGILADDMGLGKTVQMIAAIAYEKEHAQTRMPSLIVTPTSLTYNWLAEIAHFAPGLEAVMISGSQPARAQQIARITQGDAPDVVITSYPLLRRDVALMRDIPFRFAVLDEAQQVKNAQSVGAHAVKQLTAQTRVALTGTPMENHAGELWSIFDYILPGYLPGYNDFMRRYADGQNAEELRLRIRPFLMRRLKRDVLSELPEKMEDTLVAEMPSEQRRVYNASIAQKRARVDEILRVRGMGKGRAEVLAAITELRQICCHPVLCLPDYSGMSGKLELLMDLLLPALTGGHRVLLFSQFTAMLKIILRRLTADGVDCLYLDGETPSKERLALCDRFNAGGEGCPDVFLISLKAGGTGLNLTGADTVIHYDPWWNPTTEMQAIDRAHRIGQTRSVQVIRLVMHHSIEEQVLRMSARKRRLFDKLITAGEQMPTRLSDADILSLFQETHEGAL